MILQILVQTKLMMMELALRMTKQTAILHQPVRFDKICPVKNVSSRIVVQSKMYSLALLSGQKYILQSKNLHLVHLFWPVTFFTTGWNDKHLKTWPYQLIVLYAASVGAARHKNEPYLYQFFYEYEITMSWASFKGPVTFDQCFYYQDKIKIN